MARPKSKSKSKSESKSKATSKLRSKLKSKAKTKKKAASKLDAMPTLLSMISGGATCFDDLTWGMSLSEVASRYRQRVQPGARSLSVRREFNGFPADITFHFNKDGGLVSIDVLGLNTYSNWGDGDNDENKLIDWIERKAGHYDRRDPAYIWWNRPTVKIWTSCSSRLSAYFEIPEP